MKGNFTKPRLKAQREFDSFNCGLLLCGNPGLGLPVEISGVPLTFQNLATANSERETYSNSLERREPSRIARYLRQILGGTAPKLNEAKLIVVGPGGAGKSSIIEQLIEGKFSRNKPSTHGVVVRSMDVHSGDGLPVKLNIWDFGGQELQHSTHEFFMTERSVYLLAYNPREDQSAQSVLYYWLELIRMIAPNAPIIVALTKQDEFRGHISDAQALMRDFPIVDFVRISCDLADDTHCNFVQLRQLIEKEVLKLEHVSNRLPANWLKVKDSLVSTNEDFLAFGDYQSVCEMHGVQDIDDQVVLARFLNDLGTMLNYSDRIPLEKTSILNPRWVTEGVYALILSDELRQSNGVLDELLVARLDELVERMLRSDGRLKASEQYISRYPNNTHRFILEMMKVFLLCHELPRGIHGHASYLVPNALPVDEPTDLEVAPTDALRFELHYPKLLPTSVISLFMVYIEAHPAHAKMWRQGIQGSFGGHRYIVTLHDREKKIKVAVWGDAQDRFKTLDRIRHQLDRANRLKKRLDPIAWVPLPGDELAGIEYETLVKLEENDVVRHQVVGSDGKLREIVVLDLLRGIGERHVRLRRRLLKNFSSDAFDDVCRRFFPVAFEEFTPDMDLEAKSQLLVDLAYNGAWLTEVDKLLSFVEKTTVEKESGTPFSSIPPGFGVLASNAGPRVHKTSATERTFEPGSYHTILHLSDLHFTGVVSPKSRLQWLLDDLRSLSIAKIDFAVLSGDFTDKGSPGGFRVAASFVKNLCKSLSLDVRRRCLIVPGNHDLQDIDQANRFVLRVPAGTPETHWCEAGTHGFLVRDIIEHRKRLDAFAEFHKKVLGRKYPADPAKQANVVSFEEEGLQFWLLNSAWEIDNTDRSRVTINESALAKVVTDCEPRRSRWEIIEDWCMASCIAGRGA